MRDLAHAAGPHDGRAGRPEEIADQLGLRVMEGPAELL
jgi:hypothetical protein